MVIGVSSDSDASHSAFAAKHRLPFHLVSDPSGTLRQAFGVRKALGFLPGRVTYVIDRDGVVRLVFQKQLQGPQHVSEALSAVKSLVSKA